MDAADVDADAVAGLRIGHVLSPSRDGPGPRLAGDPCGVVPADAPDDRQYGKLPGGRA